MVIVESDVIHGVFLIDMRTDTYGFKTIFLYLGEEEDTVIFNAFFIVHVNDTCNSIARIDIVRKGGGIDVGEFLVERELEHIRVHKG